MLIEESNNEEASRMMSHRDFQEKMLIDQESGLLLDRGRMSLSSRSNKASTRSNMKMSSIKRCSQENTKSRIKISQSTRDSKEKK